MHELASCTLKESGSHRWDGDDQNGEQQANAAQNIRPDARVQPKQPTRTAKPEAGDYIDFEEIK